MTQSLRRASASDAESLGRPGLLSRYAWPGSTFGLNRSVEAQRHGLVTGIRSSIRGNRRTHHYELGEAVVATWRSRIDLDLHGRWHGGRGHIGVGKEH